MEVDLDQGFGRTEWGLRGRAEKGKGLGIARHELR